MANADASAHFATSNDTDIPIFPQPPVEADPQEAELRFRSIRLLNVMLI